MTKMSCLFYFFQPAWYLFSRYVFQIHTNCLNVWHDTKKVSSLSEPHFDKARKPILSVFLLDCSTCTSFFFHSRSPTPRVSVSRGICTGFHLAGCRCLFPQISRRATFRKSGLSLSLFLFPRKQTDSPAVVIPVRHSI